MSIESLFEWVIRYQTNIILSLVIISVYVLFRRYIKPKIEKFIARDGLKNKTLDSAFFSVTIFLGILTFALICLIWGFDFKGLLALSTGIVAITGVALFANWSILSNVTAFFILLVHQSYKRGNYIRVIDMDNYIEGYISDITLFNTKMITEDKEIIIYPNTLLIARPTFINPKHRAKYIGKTETFQSTDSLTVDE